MVRLAAALDGSERILANAFKDLPASALQMVGAVAQGPCQGKSVGQTRPDLLPAKEAAHAVDGAWGAAAVRGFCGRNRGGTRCGRYTARRVCSAAAAAELRAGAGAWRLRLRLRLRFESASQGEMFLGLEEGVLVKAGTTVVVSARRALHGGDSSRLSETVEQKFLALDVHKQATRAPMFRLETGLLQQFACPRDPSPQVKNPSASRQSRIPLTSRWPHRRALMPSASFRRAGMASPASGSARAWRV